jgi:hypothetical protein
MYNGIGITTMRIALAAPPGTSCRKSKKGWNGRDSLARKGSSSVHKKVREVITP